MKKVYNLGARWLRRSARGNRHRVTKASSFCENGRKSWMCNRVDLAQYEVQSTLVISTSVISNNRLSRRENLLLVFTQKSKIRLQNIVARGDIAPGEQFLPFSTILSIYIANLRSQIT